ncbi:PRD domain-containing protein [Hydrogenoanaerobacterium saccharovorans]|uniref:PRD domain-containing protein n=1 Tax=Hydrogenoanaerobacterium saccharovorans TaxID=474960 RepID=A0A1H7ZAU1_9FIRM|nr:PRD domain-containing protein [Hydrogenoanaerobacterium saccharovorans]RPF48715.1 PRD domain-containing protein [Hydrogenoanaerobacterium saccharovorans]SEM55520.1 PRD domain-containing protein [Hydrogenoanaerobacterium saccharovorans]
MSLELRLGILRQSEMLSDNNYHKIQQVISYFKEKQNIDLNEENAATFITHLCSSLERISKGEKINEIDKDVYSSVKEESTFDQAVLISKDLQAMLPEIPDSELKFIIMHIGVLLGRI